jgi:hypothetical protein
VAASTTSGQASSKAPRGGRGADEPPSSPTPPEARTGGSQLVRVTVNLTSRSYEDLLRLAESTGMGKTDVVNRALQVYALVEKLLDQGKGSLSVTHANGEQERIYIL